MVLESSTVQEVHTQKSNIACVCYFFLFAWIFSFEEKVKKKLHSSDNMSCGRVARPIAQYIYIYMCTDAIGKEKGILNWNAICFACLVCFFLLFYFWFLFFYNYLFIYLFMLLLVSFQMNQKFLFLYQKFHINTK